MSNVVITHRVADVEKWLSFTSERAAVIGDLGGSNVMDHVATDGSDVVAIACERGDVDSAPAAVQSPSPELGAAMEKHGVVPPLSVSPLVDRSSPLVRFLFQIPRYRTWTEQAANGGRRALAV
jgi:hypothetical protein